MKKIILPCFLFLAVACTSPEDSVNNNTDSARDAKTEGTVTNTPPGGTTPNKSGGSRADTSMDATTGKPGGSTTTGRSGTAGSSGNQGSAGTSKRGSDSMH